MLVVDMGISRNDFFNMSIYECDLVAKEYKQKLELDYHITFMASYNALGFVHGGKKFKAIPLFEEEKEVTKKISTEEKNNILNHLFDKFNVEGVL